MMKTILKYVSILVFTSLHSACAFVITENSLAKVSSPNPQKAYVFGNLFASRELDRNSALLLERAIRANVVERTHIKFSRDDGFYFIEVTPGTYKLAAIENYDDTYQVKAIQSLSEKEQVFSANTAYYLGNMELRAKYEVDSSSIANTMALLFNDTELCKAEHKFTEATNLLHKMYPGFINIKTVDSKFINKACNVSAKNTQASVSPE